MRFKGKEGEDLKCDGTIPTILSLGGFEVKAMCMSGEPDGAALEKLGNSVLGLGWSTAEDMLCVNFRVNVSQHKRGKPTGPDITENTINELKTAQITKRVCLRVTSSQYDPLGVASPLIIILKCEMKELYKMNLSWDEEFQGLLKEKWISTFQLT